MSTVLHSVYDLKNQAEVFNEKLVVTSGGFDPLHVGHLRCLIDSADIARKMSVKTKLAVIVNGDNFLLRKKGYAFMPESERIEIISNINGVDYVVPWDDGTQNVIGALNVLKPIVFTKGGDRNLPEEIPELETCNAIKCRVIVGVGGGKIQSSSNLLKSLISNNIL